MSGLVKYLKVWLSVETKTISKMLTMLYDVLSTTTSAAFIA